MKMKNVLKYFCAASLIFSAPLSFAQKLDALPQYNGTASSGSSTTSSTTTATSTSTSSSGTSQTGTADNISTNTAANNVAKSNSQQQVISYIVGGAEIATGAVLMATHKHSEAPFWMGAMLVVMGGTSLMQGNANGDIARQAAITAGQTYSDTSPYNDSTKAVDPTYNELLKSDKNFQAVNTNLKKAAGTGGTNATGTVATINGKTYTAADLSSVAAMKAAGLPQGLIDGLEKYKKDAEKMAMNKVGKVGAMTASTGFDEGGGGGAGLGGGAPADDPMAAYAAGLGKGNGAGVSGRDPTSLAGMSKNYNGEPIGVAADSIFLMMNRRYKVKDSQESFYSEKDISLQK